MRLTFGILFALMLAGNAAAQDPADVAALTALEGVWNQAHVRGDTEALDRLWADDIVVSIPNMKPMSRADALELTRSPRVRFDRYDSSDLRVRVYGDTAVVTGRLVRSRKLAAILVEDVWLFTKVYVRSGSDWKVVSFHASPTP